MKVGIVGLGLIGGSMAIDLKRRGFADEIIGVEADAVNAAAALKIGLVDRVAQLQDCIGESDLIVLAVPVGAAVRMLPMVLDRFSELGCGTKVVMDVCSTKEQLARIPQPFYRTDRSRSRSEGGTGLGLSLCAKIADAHGAVLEFRSAVGEGTVAEVKLGPKNLTNP
jgi:predicted dinucleotide-binding enzyme